MSYILDALTKSQQQRLDGNAPPTDVPRIGGAATGTARSGYRDMALLVLAAAALALAVQSLSWQSRTQEPVEPVTSAAGVVGTAVPSAPVAPRAAQPVPEPTATDRDVTTAPATPPRRPHAFGRAARPSAPALPVATARETAAPVAPLPAAVAEPVAEAAGGAPHPSHGTGATMGATAEALALPRPPAVPISPETNRLANELQAMADELLRDDSVTAEPHPIPQDTAGARPATAPVAEEIREATPVPHSPDAAGALPPPRELSLEMASLTINAHAYAEAPAERLVIINMQRYREGERLREGPRLVAITPTGVELSHGSHRFTLRAR